MQKTRITILFIAFTLVIVPCQYISAMLIPGAPSTLIHRTPHVSPISNSTLTRHGSQADQQSVRQAVHSPHNTVFKAVEQGDLEVVKDHFEAWRYTLLPWEYYHQAVADTLQHAAKCSPEKTDAIVAYLMQKVTLDYIRQPDTLLTLAIQNNHGNIIKYIATASGHTVDTVLRKSFIALSKKLVPGQLHSNLEVIKKLFAVLPLDQHDTQLRSLLPLAPTHMHNLITQTVRQHLYPPRVHMVEDSSVGIALTDIDLFYEDEVQTTYPPQVTIATNLSPLHQAVLKKDYQQCMALLTTFKEPVLQNEKLPIEALIVTRSPDTHVPDKEFQAAVATMTDFTARMHLKVEQHFKLAHTLLTAKDSKGRTAFDIAQETKASAEMLNILNPNDPHTVKNIIAAKLNYIIMNNLAEHEAKKIQAQQAEAQRAQLQKIHEQLINKQLKVGDKVYINGQEYTVMDTQKSK